MSGGVEQGGSLGTILGVWPHPDDELASAGIMACSARNGDRVVCVTATRGERGLSDEQRWPLSKIAEVREAELMASLAILGVKEHRWLDYQDGSCASVHAAEAVSKIQAVLEDVRPDCVFTYGPDGYTGHPDHKAVSAWTTEAFLRAAKPGAKLYYATTTPEWAERFVPGARVFNIFLPGSPLVTPLEGLAIHFELPPDLLELKMRAVKAHASQYQEVLTVMGEDLFREAMSEEFFRLGAPSLPRPARSRGLIGETAAQRASGGVSTEAQRGGKTPGARRRLGAEPPVLGGGARARPPGGGPE